MVGRAQPLALGVARLEGAALQVAPSTFGARHW